MGLQIPIFLGKAKIDDVNLQSEARKLLSMSIAWLNKLIKKTENPTENQNRNRKTIAEDPIFHQIFSDNAAKFLYSLIKMFINIFLQE